MNWKRPPSSWQPALQACRAATWPCTSWWSTRSCWPWAWSRASRWPRCLTASPATTPRACGFAAMRRTRASRPRCSGATAAGPSPRAMKPAHSSARWKPARPT
eukprot:gene19157-24484_t